MRKTVLAVTIMSMLGWLTLATRSSVVEATIAQGTLSLNLAGGGNITTSKVDVFSETVNVPAGTWAVDITKDIDAATTNLKQALTVGTVVSSARVTIGGVTRRFQNGTILSIQSIFGVVPQEKVSLVFAGSTN